MEPVSAGLPGSQEAAGVGGAGGGQAGHHTPGVQVVSVSSTRLNTPYRNSEFLNRPLCLAHYPIPNNDLLSFNSCNIT